MARPELSKQHVEILRFLVERYNSDETLANHVDTREIEEKFSKDAESIQKTVEFFERHGIIEWQSIVSIIVQPRAVEVLDKIDHRNYFEEWRKKFLASRPLALTAVIVVVLPLIVQWIEMIESICKWIGILD